MGVRLNTEIQDRRTDGSRLARSKRSTMSSVSGLPTLNASHFSSCSLRYESISKGVFEDEGDCAVHLRKGADRWVGFEDFLSRAAIAELLNHDVDADSRTGHIISAISDFNVWVRGKHRGYHVYYTLSKAVVCHRGSWRIPASLSLVDTVA